MLRTFLAAGLLALVPALSDGPARIDVERTDDALLIRGIFESATPHATELDYQLDVSKQGTSGTSSTRQGGAFTPTTGLADTLSTVQLGVQSGDTVHVGLRVLGPSGVLAEASFDDVIR